jgi:hypothetical protein
MAGVTPEGFVKKTLEEILQDVGDRQRAVFGAAFDTSESTAMGQLNGTWASAFAEAWEVLQECFHASDPDAATHYALTVLAGLTGTARRPAAGSISRRQRLSLNAGVTVPDGALISHAGRPDILFAVQGPVTNSGGSPALIECVAVCTQTGPISALAGNLTDIVNPVAGWTATTNLSDAVLGRNIDSDIVLRQRREAQLALRGGSTLAAIRADLLNVEAVPELATMRGVLVLENTTDAVVDTMPPHSIEALIDDGDVPSIDDDIIAQIIWDSKAAGIQTFGVTTATATDATGDPQPVKFTRVTLRPVYIDITVAVSSDFPVNGSTLVKEQIVLEGADYTVAELVIALQLRAAALNVAGVLDVPVFELGFAPAPSGTTNLAPGTRARATFNSVNIAVTVI